MLTAVCKPSGVRCSKKSHLQKHSVSCHLGTEPQIVWGTVCPGGKYGVWWKGVQRKGKAGNCKQQGASKQVAGKGEGAEKVVYSHDIGKMLKIATTGQIEACLAD